MKGNSDAPSRVGEADIDTRLLAAYEAVGEALVAISGEVRDATSPRASSTSPELERRIVDFSKCLRMADALPREIGSALTVQLRRFGNTRLPALVDRAFRVGDERWVEDQFEHGERLWDPLLLIQHHLSARAWDKIEAAYSTAAERLGEG